MKILFVSGGNSQYEILPFIKSQSESLKKMDIKVEHFLIKGTGLTGYLQNIPKLRKVIKAGEFDIIHAHFSKSGYVATFAKLGYEIPVITSLLGSDIQGSFFIRSIIKFFYKFFWKKTIVKSERMKTHLGLRKLEVIPNGINFDEFNILNKSKIQEELNFDQNKKYLIWVSNPDRYEKNFELAKKSVECLNNTNIELRVLNGMTHSDISKYMNAADVLLLTSLWEGSPNVVKEAMACNLPIVSTDVGDVRDVIKGVQGCYLGSYEPKEFAEQIKKAIAFGKRTSGRKKIEYLDEKKIAAKIIKLYNDVKKER